ncbi:hypothetical protein [Neotabrizicola shimadae]|uniref:DUF4268 domain-containing protein n=1 Tax=Neotabrizicola shimadae TaxID=2807096 RepID=A0A8G0ZRR8_9RHOB|nr:hypothetical protein [Neotabrizicola shimadae]QYZ68883.1 hypothetical protein JO391_14100 [Neotabrizicola shimadae]
MTSPPFGTLADIAPREAWFHEERDFTPWLAANIDGLAKAIGIPLELTGTEVRVEAFEADILARNPMDDTVVLIENQLEATDHTHLGQILTYLAGLEAQTVIWISPSFREPHLSAVNWLNEHTSERFAFFGVKLRVVRIGDSPYAPIFEVVAQPNGWERRLTTTRRKAEAPTALGERRRAFWSAYHTRYPAVADLGIKPVATSSVWARVDGLAAPANLSLWIGSDDCGAFLRPARGGTIQPIFDQLSPFAAELETALGATFQASGENLLSTRFDKGYANEADWPTIIDWMEKTRMAYLAALGRVAAVLSAQERSDGR